MKTCGVAFPQQPSAKRDPPDRGTKRLSSGSKTDSVELRKMGVAKMIRFAAIRNVIAVTGVILIFGANNAHGEGRPRFKAVAFDYFVIFNPNSVTPEVEKAFPGTGAEFTKMWRSKQFEYGFLRSITNRHADFLAVTQDALIYTAEAMKLDLPQELRERLLNAYLSMKLWPDSEEALRKLKSAGVRIFTIANFSPKMLRANADNAGITTLFDELLSTEVNSTYKPDPRAYELGMKRRHLKKEDIVFAAFGGWDAYGAKNFGYSTIWVNRLGLPLERLPEKPDRIANSMEDVLDFVIGRH
jgi:2-haloacid dehalogenase